jgi:hypothetical protein
MDTLTLKELKEIAKSYKEHHSIKNVAKMKRSELASELSKVFDIKDGQVHKKEDRCWEGYEPTPGKEPYSKGSCKKIEGDGLGDRIKQAMSEIRSLKQRMQGGKIAPSPKEKQPEYDKIPWEDIKWGSFTAQWKAYNAQHDKEIPDLDAFANYILKNPDGKKFADKTKRRARFYLNVLK